MTNGHGGFPEDPPECNPEDVEFENLTPQEQLAVLRKDLNEIREEAAQAQEFAQEQVRKAQEYAEELVKRAQADLANFRRRTEEEYRNLQREANRLLIVKLLPVVDELELAINHLSDGEAGDSWIEGVKLIHRKAYGLLEAEGLSKIDTVGAQFDPLLHEAIGVVDSKEHPSGCIVEVVRNGYRLHDRVIQAAQVVVAR